MTPDDSSNNARLRYYFWKYLDWQQRLKVLVALDLLPSTVIQPVPQTLERIALNAATNEKSKLHDLWKAIMELVPEPEKEPNPFAPEES